MRIVVGFRWAVANCATTASSATLNLEWALDVQRIQSRSEFNDHRLGCNYRSAQMTTIAGSHSRVAVARAPALRLWSGLLFDETPFASLPPLIVASACTGLEFADEASICLASGGRTYNITASSELVAEVEDLFRPTRPSHTLPLRAPRENASADDRTPRHREGLVRAALARGFPGVLTTPLMTHSRRHGFLRLYSRTQHCFSLAEEEMATLFAREAAVVLANGIAFMSAGLLNKQLTDALDTRDIIGQAKGIIMAREGLTSEAAFSSLCRASQRTNEKLRVVAEQLVRATT